MSVEDDLPDGIMSAITLLRELRKKTYLSKAEREGIQRAKLNIAFWACRRESILPSRENLTYVLGADAPDIMSAYDKYLERADEKADAGGADSRDRRDGGIFWKNV